MCRAFNIFQIYQYFTINWRSFYWNVNNFHEYLIQHSLKSGDTKDHFRQVKWPGTAPYWNAWVYLINTSKQALWPNIPKSRLPDLLIKAYLYIGPLCVTYDRWWKKKWLIECILRLILWYGQNIQVVLSFEIISKSLCCQSRHRFGIHIYHAK